MSKRLSLVLMAVLALMAACKEPAEVVTTTVDSRTYVPEEGGTTFTKITDETTEQVYNPITSRSPKLQWWVNPVFDITSDGKILAMNCFKNDRHNVFVKDLAIRGVSQQRTFRTGVRDVCFSPDGQKICFSEVLSGYGKLYLTSATQGAVVQMISPSNGDDYGPRFTKDGKKIFFTRWEGRDKYSIWSYDMDNGSYSNYCYGMNPMPINDEEFLCTRVNSYGLFEIWRINYMKGTESLILSQEKRSFSSAQLSPDGRWIVCVGNTVPGDLKTNKDSRENCDIYVVRTDGSMLTQLTYHTGDDVSPVWSPDGKSIYFLSQRGSANARFNIWKMNFTL